MALMSRRMLKALGDLVDAAGQLLVVLGPVGAIPHLQAVPSADHDDVALQPAVVHEEAGEHHASRRVEVDLVGVGGEEAIGLSRARGERVAALKGGGRLLLVCARSPDGHASLDALGEDNASRQGRPELRWNREPVLGVERVVEGPTEGQLELLAKRKWTEVPEWEEPRHPGPNRCATITHIFPLCNLNPHRGPSGDTAAQISPRVGAI